MSALFVYFWPQQINCLTLLLFKEVNYWTVTVIVLSVIIVKCSLKHFDLINCHALLCYNSIVGTAMYNKVNVFVS